ncbi:MAG: dephospho-CoA kinase [Bacteroidales bacterium]|nr:dephospho-CoA kinase [Bacteroidales bacterium]
MKGSRVILCTGGIGSGKSCVVRAFEVMGAPFYDCDAAAKDLYDRDPELLEEVVKLVGRGVIGEDGRLDRSALAGRIFTDPALLASLESLVHPAVIRDFEKWKESREEPVVVIESAILLEKRLPGKVYDYVLAVTAPEDVRIRRVVLRDGTTEDKVRQRMAAQWSDERRAACADFILENNDLQPMLPAIIEILEKIKEDGKD